ncbi:type VII secretion protein EsaA [Bacillus haynesii]|uniref:type VII secretion protein EsaA n=1 Tax=Bacillus haynesii TaxID=1925021 RepID=UPI001F25D3AE|nr:type VII secretion protein EsaA [Bacillus haynesii]MEC1455490.1 type VII secretion protein EsaA [Bacillus haynesii]MEC1573824.1 type VII secretion protein EsaA [Bacillus haynesii]UIN45428.1 type VII secretion protein EsaA [Bacillus licheniformis]WIY55734.1 type VII secretion protein EsaA [Bacillus licheniformis]
MTEQQKSTLKIISAIVTIILLPVLFFHFIGENPTKKVSNATREIAVVNEDTGILKDDGTVDQDALLGNEISASLVDRPDYKWTVVNRSAAESGLAEKQYDAIVYIPSDFSQNILSYNHERPQKAELEFKIQDQLDAVNKEKVQRELQDAQKTVSKKMSSLYWRFVKQGVKKVRKEFDSIVNKESEFQNAMYNFYKPSSNNLAGEVERQKEMIDRLKESINETEGTSKERHASVEESKKQLDSFVDNVNQYKQYQEKQSELLQAAQADSEGQIQDGLTVIKEKQSSVANRFSDKMNGMTRAFGSLQNQFGLAVNSNDNLQEYRYNWVPQNQLGKISTLQSELISNYKREARQVTINNIESNSDMLKYRAELFKSDNKDTPKDEDPGDDGKDDSGEDDDNKNIEINLDDETAELEKISKELEELSNNIQTQNKEEPEPPSSGEAGDNTSLDPVDKDQSDENNVDDTNNEDPPSAGESPGEQDGNNLEELKKELNNISVNIADVKSNIDQKTREHNEELKKKIDNLDEKVTKLNDKIDELNDTVDKLNKKFKEERDKDFENICNNIIKLEKELKDYDINPEVKQVFKNQDFVNRDINQLMDYYNLLSVYHATVTGKFKASSSLEEGMLQNSKDKVDTVLRVDEDENTKWENLKNNMLATSEDIEAYTTDMTDFVKSYGDFISEKQTDVLNELSTISERANAVSEQLRNPEGAGTAVMQGDATDGTMVISMQDTLGNDILQLSNMLGSLSETQSGVIEYTGNIQESVNDVQKKADTLNSNWGQNVATTKLIRGDVYGILGNAFGGNDGYVYDHLASPVKISGDVPESKAQNVPPVVILVIVMLSSLLIGYFSHHYQNAPLLVRGALFGILNIIVGLMISLFGLNIYSLADDQAVMWSVFTILLLVASSAIIRTAFMLGSIAGGIATAAMVLFYVAPLLDLAMPNFSFNNPVSTVYMSIQYGTGSQFALGIGALILITIIAIAVPFIVDFAKSRTEESETDHDA